MSKPFCIEGRHAIADGAHREQAILSAITEAGYIDATSGRKLAFALCLRDVSLSSDLHEFFDADLDLGAILAVVQEAY